MDATLPRLNAALEGRYAVERTLGQGGMATVYLARDVRHDRRVALKVLRADLAAVMGAERFLSEIRTTANLQHPHILPLHDSGDADGFLFYVMPYVEGESLRDRIAREKQLSVDEALRIARAVAGALHYAHRQGVIHRDVKPENVLLHDGQPLVADFGIALAVSSAGAGRLTETGLSLGTPYYMSPEQATADRDPGPQSDVYSLACMLYEMLVGDPPHTGPSAQAVLAKILTERPRPVTELRETVPAHVGAAVAKGLERLPADRFDTADAFAKALDDAGFAHRTGMTGAGAAPGGGVGGLAVRRWMSFVPWAVAAAAVAFAVFRPEPPTPTPPATRVLVTMADSADFSESGAVRRGRNAVISPDGTEIIYRGRAAPGESDARAPLFRRRLDGLTSSPIPGSEGWVRPTYSRDGRFIAFFVDEPLGARLGVWPLEGGAPIRLDAAVFPGGAVTWGDDGALYWFAEAMVIHWVPGTAAVDTVARYEGGTGGRTVTDALPGSRAILLNHSGGTMGVLDLATGEMTDLGPGLRPSYLATGHIVFAREDGTLMVQPFDPSALRTLGPAVSTPDQASRNGGGVEYDVAGDGSLLYVQGDGGVESLALANRSGRMERLAWIEPTTYQGVSLSPDGRRVAAAQGSPAEADLWVFDLQDRTRLRVTQDGQSSRPVWHPREPRLLFVHDAAGPGGLEVWTLPADGSSPGTSLVAFSSAPADVVPEPDGRGLILRMPSDSSVRSIFRYVPGETEKPVPLVVSTFFDMAPAPSPDGRWLAYQSNRSGRGEVYARPHPDGGAVVPISLEGGSEPVWSRDGRELFYVTDDRWLWSARVAYDARSLRVVERTLLFELRGRLGAGARANYDVTPDGRFLLVQGAETNRQLVLVRNWAQSVTGADLR